MLECRKGHFWCFGAFLLCHGWCYRSCKNVHKFDKLLVLVLSMGNRPLKRHNLMALLLWLPCYRSRGIDACKIWVIKGAVTAAQFILFNFANYLPSIAMELKVTKEIMCKLRNQSCETNKWISLLSIIFEFARSRGKVWEAVRLNSFQKPEFQSVSILFSFAHLWHLLFLLCYFNLPFK